MLTGSLPEFPLSRPVPEHEQRPELINALNAEPPGRVATLGGLSTGRWTGVVGTVRGA